MLLDNLTLQDVQVGINAENWEDAIAKSAAPLIQKGSIEASYVQGMIDSVHENGPYFVLTKHIALAHARPECGVNKMDLNFTLLKTPVQFGNKELDPVKLIITLAAVDADSHLEVISDLTDILIDEDLMENILSAESAEVMYGLLRTKG